MMGLHSDKPMVSRNVIQHSGLLSYSAERCHRPRVALLVILTCDGTMVSLPPSVQCLER